MSTACEAESSQGPSAMLTDGESSPAESPSSSSTTTAAVGGAVPRPAAPAMAGLTVQISSYSQDLADGKQPIVRYNVVCTLGVLRWVVPRRYSEFCRLHDSLVSLRNAHLAALTHALQPNCPVPSSKGLDALWPIPAPDPEKAPNPTACLPPPELPSLPPRAGGWWRIRAHTNTNPDAIEKRQKQLEYYLQQLVKERLRSGYLKLLCKFLAVDTALATLPVVRRAGSRGRLLPLHPTARGAGRPPQGILVQESSETPAIAVLPPSSSPSPTSSPFSTPTQPLPQ
eukprot:RCo015254